MKKFLFKLAVIAVVGLILLGAAGYFLFGPASRTAVEQGSSYALGVDASLGAVKVGVGANDTTLGLESLSIDNPKGFEGSPFLEVGELAVGVKTFSVLSSTVKVPSITLDGLHLRIVQDGTRSNFKEILDHARSLSSGETAPAAPEGEGGGGPELLVGDVALRGIQLSADLRGIPGLEVSETFTVPDLEIDVAAALEEAARRKGEVLDKVEQARGMSIAELSTLIVDELLRHGIAQSGDHLPAGAVDLLQGGFEGLENRLRDEAGKLIDDAQSQVDDLVDEQKAKLESEKDKLEGQLNEGKKKLEDEVKKGLGGLLGGGDGR